MTEKKFEAISVPSPPPCQSWSNTTARPSPSLGYERRGGEVEMYLRAPARHHHHLMVGNLARVVGSKKEGRSKVDPS